MATNNSAIIYVGAILVGFGIGFMVARAIFGNSIRVENLQETIEALKAKQVITRPLFTMNPHEKETLSFFLEREGFQAGENILFLFSNAPCGQSSQYYAHLSWGPNLSKKVPVPCARDAHIAAKYFTGFGGGNVQLDVVFTSGDNSVQGAGVRILRGEEGRKFPW